MIAECVGLRAHLADATRENSALKSGKFTEGLEDRALGALRQHNQATSAEITRLLTCVVRETTIHSRFYNMHD